MSNKTNNNGESSGVSLIFLVTGSVRSIFQTMNYNRNVPYMRDIGRRGDRSRAGAADRASTGGWKLCDLESVQLQARIRRGPASRRYHGDVLAVGRAAAALGEHTVQEEDDHSRHMHLYGLQAGRELHSQQVEIFPVAWRSLFSDLFGCY